MGPKISNDTARFLYGVHGPIVIMSIVVGRFCSRLTSPHGREYVRMSLVLSSIAASIEIGGHFKKFPQEKKTSAF